MPQFGLPTLVCDHDEIRAEFEGLPCEQFDVRAGHESADAESVAKQAGDLQGLSTDRSGRSQHRNNAGRNDHGRGFLGRVGTRRKHACPFVTAGKLPNAAIGLWLRSDAQSLIRPRIVDLCRDSGSIHARSAETNRTAGHTEPRPSPEKTIRIRVAHIALVLLALAGRPAVAQVIDSTLASRHLLAESYLRAAQFDRAIALFEDLLARSPGNFIFSDRLQEAYEAVKRYDDAIALVDARLAGQESRTVLLSEKARLFYLSGNEETAFATWDAALSAEPSQPGAYLVVYRSLLQPRLFDRAVSVLERGRETLGNRELFRSDLAQLYGLVGRHAEAMAEYLAILEQNEGQLTFVRIRLQSLIEAPDAMAAAVSAAERAVRGKPLSRPVRELLAWLYLEAGRFGPALGEFRALDRLERQEGLMLYAFALQAVDGAAYDEALAAFGEILERYPTAPSAADAQLGLGGLHERRAASLPADSSDSARLIEFASAISEYQAFIQRWPGHPSVPDARYRVARIHLDVLFDLEAAEQALDALIAGHPGTPAANQAAFDLGRLDVARDRLESARVHFTRLADRLRSGELAESARHELALIHFYRGEFEAARALAESMKENTSADVSNDAISLKVLLVESKGPDSLDMPLRDYATVLLRERQRKPDEALTRLEVLLAGLGDHALVDEAMYRRAALLATLGRTPEAIAAYLEFPLIHGESPLADRALLAAADLQMTVIGDLDGAITTLTRLLQDFPGSLLASEARSRIRRLRGDAL